MTDEEFSKLPPPIVVRKDEADLFLGALTEYDAPYKVVLDASQVALWDAYVAACRAEQDAKRAVLEALRTPTKQEIRCRKRPA